MHACVCSGSGFWAHSSFSFAGSRLSIAHKVLQDDARAPPGGPGGAGRYERAACAVRAAEERKVARRSGRVDTARSRQGEWQAQGVRRLSRAEVRPPDLRGKNRAFTAAWQAGRADQPEASVVRDGGFRRTDRAKCHWSGRHQTSPHRIMYGPCKSCKSDSQQ